MGTTSRRRSHVRITRNVSAISSTQPNSFSYGGSELESPGEATAEIVGPLNQELRTRGGVNRGVGIGMIVG